MTALADVDFNRNSSRRLFLTAGPVAAVFGAMGVAAVAQDPGPDAALLALGREFEIAWTEERRIENEFGEESDKFAAACERTGRVIDKFYHVETKTIEGFRIKARAIAWTHSGVFDPSDFLEEGRDFQLAAMIIRDLLAL